MRHKRALRNDAGEGNRERIGPQATDIKEGPGLLQAPPAFTTAFYVLQLLGLFYPAFFLL